MIRSLKDKLSFYGKHNFLLYRELRAIDFAERMSPEELRDAAEQKALHCIRHAAIHSPFYRKFYRSVDLKGRFDEVYPSVPVLYKQNIRGSEKEIASLPLSFMIKAHTSGTSGSPLALYRTPVSVIREHAYILYYKMRHGFQIGQPMVSMRGVLDNTTLSYYNKAENTLYLSSYLLSRANIGRYADLLNKFRPLSIHAFPSSLHSMVNLMEEAGLQVEIPLSFTSSETLYPFQREKIERCLDTKVCDWYGNAERTVGLAQCSEGNYHEPAMYGMNEFRNDGVITTSFINRSYPFIKYFVDDAFTFLDKECPCGKPGAIKTVEGRVDDVVKLEDGTLIGRLGVAFQGIPNLRYAQIIQENVTEINVNMVTSSDFSSADEELLNRKLRQRLNHSVKINFHKVEESAIRKTRSGKFKLVVSTIDASQ